MNHELLGLSEFISSSYFYFAILLFCFPKVGVAISGYANITSGMDGLNDALYSVGPISVSIDATPNSFYYYQGEEREGDLS